MIRVTLPAHLRKLAHVDGEVALEIAGQITQRSILDALEARYPMLRGTIRDHANGKRRAFVRFFACGEDLSHESPDTPLPEAIATGAQPFMIVGAIAGHQRKGERSRKAARRAVRVDRPKRRHHNAGGGVLVHACTA